MPERTHPPSTALPIVERCRADERWPAAVRWTADRTVWPALLGGCRAGRDTLDAVEAAGFEVNVRRLRIPQTRVPVPSAAHVPATSRKAAAAGQK